MATFEFETRDDTGVLIDTYKPDPAIFGWGDGGIHEAVTRYWMVVHSKLTVGTVYKVTVQVSGMGTCTQTYMMQSVQKLYPVITLIPS